MPTSGQHGGTTATVNAGNPPSCCSTSLTVRHALGHAQAAHHRQRLGIENHLQHKSACGTSNLGWRIVWGTLRALLESSCGSMPGHSFSWLPAIQALRPRQLRSD